MAGTLTQALGSILAGCALGSALAFTQTHAATCAIDHGEEVWIEGGTFVMGDDFERPEERPAHEVTLDGFWIDSHEITNAQFAEFVEATGYVTIAERGLDAKDYPQLPPALLEPGSMVFQMPDNVQNLRDVTQWWAYVPGANWREPTGSGSSIAGKDDHPVVQVALDDARAYAEWAGRTLPSEAQWEYAARGGLEGATYVWGEIYTPDGRWMANTWQGTFPTGDRELDGYHGTAPVGCFEPNGLGLYDMAGNVWEYTLDRYLAQHTVSDQPNPTGPNVFLAANDRSPLPRHVIKGGSWLCAPNFCMRFRPSGRQPQEIGLGTNHIGFRTVRLP